MFQKIGEQEFKLIGTTDDNLIPRLKPGVYSAKLVKEMFSSYMSFEPATRYADYKEPSKGVFSDASVDINRFFNKSYKELRLSLGMSDKINLIFNGLPGTGKTHLACVLGEKMVREHDAVALIIDDIKDINFPKLIDEIRINDPERMIFIVLDELEKNYDRDLRKSSFLGFLDGASTRENVICIGTTNDISELPDYLTNRPGRFEKFYNFDFKGNVDMIESTLDNLLSDELLNDSILVKHIVETAVEDNIETIDHLRFLALDIIYNYQLEGSLPKTLDQKIQDIRIAEACVN